MKFFALCVFWFNLPTWMSNLLDTNNWKGLVFIFHLSGISNMWTIINYGIHVLYLSTAVVNIRWRFIAQACLYFFFFLIRLNQLHINTYILIHPISSIRSFSSSNPPLSIIPAGYFDGCNSLTSLYEFQKFHLFLFFCFGSDWNVILNVHTQWSVLFQFALKNCIKHECGY